jgi:dienelactone hydrolase
MNDKLLGFIKTRLMFSGFPCDELHSTIAEVKQGLEWKTAFAQRAHLWTKLAKRASNRNDRIAATQSWLWASRAYHAASFGFHLQPTQGCWQHDISRLRNAARLCYLRSIAESPTTALPVLLRQPAGAPLRAYLRLPNRATQKAVVIVNGLDSISEVELHAFGTWMLERGLAVLAVDLPAGLTNLPGRLGLAELKIERMAPVIAEYLQSYLGNCSIGAFGVSFGGNLIVRLLAGDPRFVAGVAVSPPAFLEHKELSVERLRTMFAWSFGLQGPEMIEKVAAQVELSNIKPPEGRILLLQMSSDELFGAEHTQRFKEWGRSKLQTLLYPGEHVGTSTSHLWLPAACDWLSQELAARKESAA